MNAQQEPTPFERRTRELLQISAANLPANIRSRLTRARIAALQAPRRRQRVRWFAWAPAGALTAAVLVALLMVRGPGRPTNSVQPLGAVAAASTEDMDLLTDSDALALAQEQAPNSDYQFYEWATAQAAARTDSGT